LILIFNFIYRTRLDAVNAVRDEPHPCAGRGIAAHAFSAYRGLAYVRGPDAGDAIAADVKADGYQAKPSRVVRCEDTREAHRLMESNESNEARRMVVVL